MILLSLFLAYYLWKKNIDGQWAVYVLVIAFIINIPYLIYTWSLTGKLFYWGNSGGMSLYWMSTPVEGEYGDWNNTSFTANCGHDKIIPCNKDLLAIHHQKDMDYVLSLPVIEQDDAYKAIAIQNIKSHPVKYLRNCFCNFSRLFFGFPTSYFYQREGTLLRFPLNSILLTFIFISVFFSCYHYKKLPLLIHFIYSLIFVYLFLSTLVSAYPRQLYVVVPLLLFWMAYMMYISVSIKTEELA